LTQEGRTADRRSQVDSDGYHMLMRARPVSCIKSR
jgi:hypothetical protein